MLRCQSALPGEACQCHMQTARQASCRPGSFFINASRRRFCRHAVGQFIRRVTGRTLCGHRRSPSAGQSTLPPRETVSRRGRNHRPAGRHRHAAAAQVADHAGHRRRHGAAALLGMVITPTYTAKSPRSWSTRASCRSRNIEQVLSGLTGQHVDRRYPDWADADPTTFVASVMDDLNLFNDPEFNHGADRADDEPAPSLPTLSAAARVRCCRSCRASG